MLARMGYRRCRDTGLLRNISEQPLYEGDNIKTYFLYKETLKFYTQNNSFVVCLH